MHFSSHTKGSPIWPNFARKLPGKIWPNRAAFGPSERRGSIWPNFACPAKASSPHFSSAKFGQILPADCPAKSGEPRLSGGPKLFKLSRLGLAKFCREVCGQNLAKSGCSSYALRNARLDAKFCRAASGQNLAKSSRAFLMAFEEQPDLAKFCPQAARQNLAKSSRDSLNNFVQLVHSFPNGGDSPAPTPPLWK